MEHYAPLLPGQTPGLEHVKAQYVVDDLTTLHGPASGEVRLPLRLNWSYDRAFDLSKPDEVRWMLSMILNEAGSESDVAAWVNRNLLEREWPAIGLSSHLRAAWEAKHPELTHV